MKIKHKLLVAFGFYILLSSSLGFLAYKEMGTITKRLKVVEIAEDINSAFLEMRRYEKNFMLRRDLESEKELLLYLGILQKRIIDIQEEIIKEIGSDKYAAMKDAISEYEVQFKNLTVNFREQQTALVSLSGLTNRHERSLPEKELQMFLHLRQYEKNLIHDKDLRSFDDFIDLFSKLDRGTAEKLDMYRSSVQRLSGLYQDEKRTTEMIRTKARIVETFTDTILKKEHANIERILLVSKKYLIYALVTIIFLGLIINIKLAANIADPIKKLERLTKKVAAGDFSEVIEVKRNDEIASLETSFNQMGERLRDTVSSLELAVQNLHRKQAQLIEAGKLASMGTLAAGVAHEINNPLAIIKEKAGLMEDILALSNMPHKEKFVGLIASITESVNRCRAITHRLLGFARRPDAKIEAFDLNQALREVVAFLEKELLLKEVRLDLELRDGLPEIVSDKSQIQQVLLNIVKNAIDAVGNGGWIRVAADLKDGQTMRITISDDGPGIPAEALSHIFEPFFTTKEKGKGTGLGLSISYGIVKNLGGHIAVESETGRGTTFVMEMPLAPERDR